MLRRARATSDTHEPNANGKGRNIPRRGKTEQIWAPKIVRLSPKEIEGLYGQRSGQVTKTSNMI
jgi:hypothetical protein